MLSEEESRMVLNSKAWIAVLITCLVMASPRAVQGSEEKPISMETILQEVAALRTLVEAQQRQIEELRAAVQPAPVGPAKIATKGGVIESYQAPQATTPASDLEKKVET